MRVDDLLLTPRKRVKRVTLLGWPGNIAFAMEGNGMTMDRPAGYKPEVPVYVYKLELEPAE